MSEHKNIGDLTMNEPQPVRVAGTPCGIDFESNEVHCRAIDPASDIGDHLSIGSQGGSVADSNCGTDRVKMSDSDHVRHVGSAPETEDHSNYVTDLYVVGDPELAVGDHIASVFRPDIGDPACTVVPQGNDVADSNCDDPSERIFQGEPVGADEIDLSGCDFLLPVVDIVSLISDIVVEHTRRQAAIKAQRRLDQAAGAMIRRLCGWTPDLPESQRNAINKQADRIFKALERGKELDLTEDEQIARIAQPFAFASLQAREPFDLLRKNAEKTLADRGKQLPVWPWVNAIRGIDVGGLCAIIGEAGDLNNYSNPAKLWKRLGLGVLDGKRQGNPGKDADSEDWIRHGYSPRRRSILWNVGYALVMVNGEGRYRTAYLRYKERLTAERSGPWVYTDPQGVVHDRDVWTKGHIARASQRYMEKLFLRDLWTVWRRVTKGN